MLSYDNWENVFLEENVNTIFNNFINTCIFCASFPIVKLKNSDKPKPWLIKGIKISSLNKRKLYLNYRNSNNHNLKVHYKNYCQILSKVIIAAKSLYYSKLISNSNNKQKTTWRIIKTVTNNIKIMNSTALIKIDDKTSMNLRNTANGFNTYFTSVADNLIKNFSKRKITNNDDPMIYLQQNFNHFCSLVKLNNTTTYEINKIINSLKSKNSHRYVMNVSFW